jgi:predicted enzyme related to lactoylglutathione lyase
MPDPFEALRTPIVPVEPDPEFAVRLRARIERALNLPKGVTVSDLSLEPERLPSDANRAREGDVIYASLWVPDVERASAFFGSVLGWTYGPGSSERSRQVEGATPRIGLWGGEDRNTLFLCYAVDDIRAAVERVRDAGGEAEEPERHPYGVVANCVDTQGSPFALYDLDPADPTRRGPANGARHGDISYVTHEVPDSAAARAFFGEVLGWRFQPGHVEDGWGIEDVVPMSGMAGGQPQATVVPMYRVDDIGAAVERVRAAGGTSTDPAQQPYGITATCTDDQGTRFYLGQH